MDFFDFVLKVLVPLFGIILCFYEIHKIGNIYLFPRNWGGTLLLGALAGIMTAVIVVAGGQFSVLFHTFNACGSFVGNPTCNFGGTAGWSAFLNMVLAFPLGSAACIVTLIRERPRKIPMVRESLNRLDYVAIVALGSLLLYYGSLTFLA